MTEALVKRLNEERGRAVAASREILERYADGAEMSGEDKEAFERANKVIDDLGLRLKTIANERKESAEIEKAFADADAKRGSLVQPDGKPVRTIGQMMREDLEASKRGETRSGGVYSQIPAEAVGGAPEHRADPGLNVGTSTKGPETVPTTLVARLIEKLFDDSALLSAGPTILRTQSGEKLKLPRLTSLGALSMSNARRTELGATNVIQKSDPTFDQVELDAFKYGQIMQVSRELVEDGVLDIEGLMGAVLGRNIANYVGYDLTLGSGTDQPNGLRTLIAVGQKVASAGGGLFPTANFDLFFDVIAKVKPGYRRNGKWLINDQATFDLRKVKMGSVYAWEPNLQGAGMPDRFLGYPVALDPNIPVPASAAGVSAIFGDMAAYYVRLVRDVRIEWSMEQAWDSDLISVKAVIRADGDAIDTDAFAAFNSIT